MIAEKVRIDKWLWAVRVFKTRSAASDACNGGKVKIEGDAVKSSKLLSGGEILSVHKEGVRHLYKVKALLSKRVGAKFVGEYLEDFTSEEELERKKFIMKSAFYRPKGMGRPTKKERRQLNQLKP